MNARELVALFCGLFIGFIAGSIGWAAATYAVLTIKDWIRKKKEGNFRLGKNIKKGLAPKLISLYDDD